MPSFEQLITTLDKAVDIWHEFLDSLATTGGNIFILIALWVACLLGLAHVLHEANVNADARSLILGTFSSVTGALMYALTGGRVGGNRNGAVAPDQNQSPVVVIHNQSQGKEGQDVSQQAPPAAK